MIRKICSFMNVRMLSIKTIGSNTITATSSAGW
jgi:hypothetical protein